MTLALEMGTRMNESETNDDSKTSRGRIRARDIEQSRKTLKQEPPSSGLSLRGFRDEAEVHAIRNALHKTGWNRKRAAQLLRISYRGLLYKIRRHNLAPPAGQS
jgi:transcriptional regulator with PAS, ATPase and Fis domain